ncbi:LuxR family transcriptional regulator [Ramlibacter henchirensis]|uniref:LuxR family transcriptional regulator n=1 Tax=Ramlibacter henchirensis TaxID=204072 RepID=A0A4Z0C1U2_9BURK|nr:helix-turn-helix transcriptional regulator [Ramlibacter henchirensis]TFZ05483.1 LuxR family transcriptional regulator [Ramlibacter henchirensis]
MIETREAAIDSAIECLYRAVSNDEEWGEALLAVGRAFDSPRASIMRTSAAMDAVLDIREVNHDPGVKRLYEQYYWAYDPAQLLTRTARLGEWLNAPQLFDPVTTPQPEYMDFAVRGGIRFVAGGKVHEGADTATFLGLQRPRDHVPFDESDAIVFRRLHKHVGRAVALSADLRRAELSRGLAGAALDALQFPVFAIDAAGKLLMANTAGDRSLREGSPLAMRQGRLHSPEGDIAGRLAGALRAAASRRGSAFSANVRGTIWLLRVVPLQEHSAAALVYANTPDAGPVPSRMLTSLLRFTQAEADVACMLADGLSPKEIAYERDVSLHTIRTQVRGIFGKAGVRRQADLTKLLFSVPRIHNDMAWAAD